MGAFFGFSALRHATLHPISRLIGRQTHIAPWGLPSVDTVLRTPVVQHPFNGIRMISLGCPNSGFQ